MLSKVLKYVLMQLFEVFEIFFINHIKTECFEKFVFMDFDFKESCMFFYFVIFGVL
jgi:hypothetical protein